MNEYIFYTDEGYCEAPNENVVENFQVIGFEKGKTKEDALKTLLENNPWIKDYSYKVENIIGCQVIR